MHSKSLFGSLAALVIAACPLAARADDHHHHSDHGHSYDHGHYYGNHSYGYGHGYGYGYRPYYSGSYYRPYWGPSFGLSIYSRPNYVYRGYVDDGGDGLGADVQRALRHRGYYHGSIDGEIGPGSRAAIRNYQANHGLYVTGRIDRPLLRSLGIG